MFSKNIADYFMISITEIRSGEILPFKVYLYFSQNNHILLWKKDGEMIPNNFSTLYQNRGMKHIWIDSRDQQLFNEYTKKTLTPEKESSYSGKLAPAQLNDPLYESYPAKTPEGSFLLSLLQSKIEHAEKKQLVSETAQTILQDSIDSNQLEHARQVIADVLAATSQGRSSHAIDELWRLAHLDRELRHSVNVATYAVLFSFAFGKIELDLIHEIATAGIIHDIGLSQIPASLTQTPLTLQNETQKKEYHYHIDYTLELVSRYSKSVSERSFQLVKEHHIEEGSSELSLLLAMADMLEVMARGYWDGTPRTLQEAFTLFTLEAPKHIRPELVDLVCKWLTSSDSQQRIQEAVNTVQSDLKNIIEDQAKDAA